MRSCTADSARNRWPVEQRSVDIGVRGCSGEDAPRPWSVGARCSCGVLRSYTQYSTCARGARKLLSRAVGFSGKRGVEDLCSCAVVFTCERGVDGLRWHITGSFFNHASRGSGANGDFVATVRVCACNSGALPKGGRGGRIASCALALGASGTIAAARAAGLWLRRRSRIFCTSSIASKQAVQTSISWTKFSHTRSRSAEDLTLALIASRAAASLRPTSAGEAGGVSARDGVDGGALTSGRTAAGTEVGRGKRTVGGDTIAGCEALGGGGGKADGGGGAAAYGEITIRGEATGRGEATDGEAKLESWRGDAEVPPGAGGDDGLATRPCLGDGNAAARLRSGETWPRSYRGDGEATLSTGTSTECTLGDDEARRIGGPGDDPARRETVGVVGVKCFSGAKASPARDEGRGGLATVERRLGGRPKVGDEGQVPPAIARV